MSRRRRGLVLILFLLTLIVGAGAVYVGIQLQQQPDITPEDTSAASASCCNNGGGANGGACNGNSADNCGGFDLATACNSSHNWCWCVRTTNQCALDGTNTPEGTSETFCGYGSGDGNACYTCPGGWTGNGSVICSGGQYMDCGNCGGTPPPPPPPPVGTCSYNSTQARVHRDVSQPWAQSITVTCGQSFETGSFHNGTGTFAGDTSLNVTRPNGQVQGSSNGGTITTSEPGTYRLVVTTNGQSGPGCTESATVTCGSVNTPTPTPTRTPTPTPTDSPSACGGSCDPTPASGVSTCPNNPPHTCVAINGDQNNGTCRLTLCAQEPTLCYANGCTIIPDCGQTCNPAEGANACEDSHVCRDPDGDGTSTCILSICDTNPEVCQPGFCTTQNAFNVVKTGTQSCGSTGQVSIVSYSIAITNTEASPRTVTVVDTLDTDVEDSFVVSGSISNGGILNNGVITWTGVSVPANGTLTLTYRINYPQSLFNSVMNNTVVVTEASVERGRDDFAITPFCTPGTALISDTADRILVAMILIIVGMLMYRLKLHEQIGQLFWEQGAGKVTNLGKGVKANQKRSFERGVEERVVSREEKSK